MEATSVAIWKRNVFAVGIATTIWVINGAIVIQGKSPYLWTVTVVGTLPIWLYIRYLAGEQELLEILDLSY